MHALLFFQWKKVFAERFLLQRNWLNGKYKLRTFEGHNQGLLLSCFMCLSIRIVTKLEGFESRQPVRENKLLDVSS